MPCELAIVVLDLRFVEGTVPRWRVFRLGKQEEEGLGRCWRDVQVVRQHIMVSPQWSEAAGRVLLGLESGTPLL